MIRKISHSSMGHSEKKGVSSRLHFSFADYYNPRNVRYGPLRVLNDELIQPGSGIDSHTHLNMEIITYVVQGELTHCDGMKNKCILHEGELHCISAGAGIEHSGQNLSDKPLRLLQIWLTPDRAGYPPQYESLRFSAQQQMNEWLLLVTEENGPGPLRIHQNARLLMACLQENKELLYEIPCGRMAYLLQIDGTSNINGEQLEAHDAAEIAWEQIRIRASADSRLMLFDLGTAF